MAGRADGSPVPGPAARACRVSPRPRAVFPTQFSPLVLTTLAFFPSSLHRFSPTRPCAITGPRQEHGERAPAGGGENLAQMQTEFRRSAKSQRGPRARNWGGVDSPAPNGEGGQWTPQPQVRLQPVGDTQGGSPPPAPPSSLASRSHPPLAVPNQRGQRLGHGAGEDLEDSSTTGAERDL